MSDIGADLQRAFDEGYEKGKADRPQEVIAQITFDEEKLREIVKDAFERFKEEYEIADRPQGEWIDKAISIIDDMQREGIIDYEQAWEFRMRARMKGADDD